LTNVHGGEAISSLFQQRMSLLWQMNFLSPGIFSFASQQRRDVEFVHVETQAT
jgi:hypothetical protein